MKAEIIETFGIDSFKALLSHFAGKGLGEKVV
jgi:predicted Zn-dependent protease with MMP-like domain